MDDYISKPLEIEEIVKAIDRAMARKSPPPRLATD